MLYEKPSLEGVLVMDRKKLGYGVVVSCLGENLTLTVVTYCICIEVKCWD